MTAFFDKIIKIVGTEMAMVAEDGTIADNMTFIDTGCYILNLIMSGTIFGGAPTNKVVGFAAEEAVGKSFLIIQIIKKFLDDDPTAQVIYNDTEGRIDKEMLKKRGVDASRVLMLYPETIEELKNINHQIISEYRTPAKETKEDKAKKDEKAPKKKKEKAPTQPKLLIVIDSMTQLPSVKEISDSAKDSDSGDMGLRAKVWRSAFRVLRQPLSKAKIPMFCAAHTYKSPGMFPTTEMAGGGGFKYAADIIAMIAKHRDTEEVKVNGKEVKVVQGNVLYFKIAKGWNIKQHSEFRAYLSYSRGLDRYFGLQDLALEAGIFKKIQGGFTLPDGAEVKERELLLNPTAYYSKEILEKIQEFVKARYQFSDSPVEELSELVDEE